MRPSTKYKKTIYLKNRFCSKSVSSLSNIYLFQTLFRNNKRELGRRFDIFLSSVQRFHFVSSSLWNKLQQYIFQSYPSRNFSHCYHARQLTRYCINLDGFVPYLENSASLEGNCLNRKVGPGKVCSHIGPNPRRARPIGQCWGDYEEANLPHVAV